VSVGFITDTSGERLPDLDGHCASDTIAERPIGRIDNEEPQGRYRWRTSSGATRQSLAENAVSRFKALVGVKLASCEFERQQVEALVKSQVLNRMTALGMPKSERVSVG